MCGPRFLLTFITDGVFDHKGYTEKSLARMIKSRARIERAATLQAATTTAVPRSNPASGSNQPAHTPQEASPADASSADPQGQEGEEISPPPPPAKEPSSDRTELLRSKPVVVGRFMQLMVPILIDVYSASVITPVRVKSLTALLKAVSFLDGEGLKGVLMVRYASL
jgi:E3 ubiquitin-protein ligase TRIP12